MEKQRSSSFSIFIIGSLFFIFGLVTWLNSVLMPFLQQTCELTNFQASFVPFAFYIAYFFTSIPSSMILKKTGFSKGMMLGLLVMAIGTTIFIPAAFTRNFLLFLIGLFVQGIGLSLLQTASNPYVTILGPIESAARRMSIMGICNKIAGMLGILILASLLFSNISDFSKSINEITDIVTKEAALQELSNQVIMPYCVMTVVLIALILFIKIAKLPEIIEEDDPNISLKNAKKSIFSYPYLWLGTLAIFFYVGAEVIAIDYLKIYGAHLGFDNNFTTLFPVFALIGLVVGYLVGIFTIPKIISQRNALIIQLILAMIFTTLAIFTSGIGSIIFIILLSFSHAIMWPAIWPLSIHDLGKHTKLGSAFLIMAIAGGAVIPLIFGKLSDVIDMKFAYSILFVSYLYILFFAVWGYKLKINYKNPV
ncbi:MAG: sugar MFS transporter [Bacteroidales bacterium]|jgi:glucose/galactose transporter|nr:sugar MFS transporter [Bacteroidales bacterium]